MAWLDANNTDAASSFRDRIAEAERFLGSRDPVLSRLIDQHGPCTLRPQTPYFPVMVETVVSQQLSTKAARSIYHRLVDVVGRRFPRPVDIKRLSDDKLREIGFSRSKTQYIKNVAELFGSRRAGPRTFRCMTDEQVAAMLTSVKGIGDWSAHMFLIFALGRLDVFPIGDLGLRNALVRAYGLRKPSLARLEKIGDIWRPYRTVGTWYLWESYDN
jgi:DNA-3-methyladenine glycosylase II